MSHKSIITLPVVILLLLVLIASVSVSGSRAHEGLLQTEDSKLIREVINKSYDVEAHAAKTFDLSSFPLVFVNDQRGGELSLSTKDFIRSVSDNSSSMPFGYLDYKIAYYTWWKMGAHKLEALRTKAVQEKRALTENELMTLIDEKGRLAMPRSQSSDISTELLFISIEIEGDRAIATFDDGLKTNQMILVKMNSNWYIAGNKILSLHP